MGCCNDDVDRDEEDYDKSCMQKTCDCIGCLMDVPIDCVRGATENFFNCFGGICDCCDYCQDASDEMDDRSRERSEKRAARKAERNARALERSRGFDGGMASPHNPYPASPGMVYSPQSNRGHYPGHSGSGSPPGYPGYHGRSDPPLGNDWHNNPPYEQAGDGYQHQHGGAAGHQQHNGFRDHNLDLDGGEFGEEQLSKSQKKRRRKQAAKERKRLEKEMARMQGNTSGPAEFGHTTQAPGVGTQLDDPYADVLSQSPPVQGPNESKNAFKKRKKKWWAARRKPEAEHKKHLAEKDRADRAGLDIVQLPGESNRAFKKKKKALLQAKRDAEKAGGKPFDQNQWASQQQGDHAAQHEKQPAHQETDRAAAPAIGNGDKSISSSIPTDPNETPKQRIARERKERKAAKKAAKQQAKAQKQDRVANFLEQQDFSPNDKDKDKKNTGKHDTSKQDAGKQDTNKPVNLDTLFTLPEDSSSKQPTPDTGGKSKNQLKKEAKAARKQQAKEAQAQKRLEKQNEQAQKQQEKEAQQQQKREQKNEGQGGKQQQPGKNAERNRRRREAKKAKKQGKK